MITYKCKDNNDFFYEDIKNLKTFSDILEIMNINETSNNVKCNILNLIKDYEAYVKANDFRDLKCPLCKHDNVLHYHKEYQRNLIFQVDNYEVISKISITVLECSYCKEVNKSKQRFHALLPTSIFPYHTYSEEFILDTLNERLIDKETISKITKKRNISHQLFYKWLIGLKKYCVSASTILKCNINIIDIAKEIKKDVSSFLFQFFETFYHPFFLFRLTCVPLVIMP